MIAANSGTVANNCMHDFVLIYYDCNAILSMAMDMNSLNNASILICGTRSMTVAMLWGHVLIWVGVKYRIVKVCTLLPHRMGGGNTLPLYI